jgi:hypothetical protein
MLRQHRCYASPDDQPAWPIEHFITDLTGLRGVTSFGFVPHPMRGLLPMIAGGSPLQRTFSLLSQLRI